MSLVSRRTQVRSTLFLVILSLSTFTAQAQVVISQVYGGGGNTGAPLKNDYVELFNRGTSPVSVTGWSVQYASSAGTTWQRTNLTGTINPGQYYLVQQAQGANTALPFPTADAVGTIAMAAGAGKVALVNNQVTLTGSCPTGLVDFVGFGSAANCFEGSGPTGTLANTTAALRAGQGCTDSNNNSADFSVGGPAPRNTSSPMFTCAGPTLPTGVGAASPNALVPGGSTQLTVSVTPGQNPTSTGLQVSADLSAIGGNATQTFFDDGVSGGDTTAGDKVFSYLVTVSVATLPGAKSLPIALTDAQSRTNGTTIAITVQEPPPPAIAINQIQGTGSLSPYSGQKVSTTGIVTARRSNGFFLQTPDGAVDGDSSTSEGIFVFTSSAPTSTATIGNEVQVTGTVVEFKPTGSSADPFAFPLTELSGTPTVTLLTTGNSLPVPVVLTAVHTSPTGSLEQLERFEAMRVYVASLTTTSPTGGFKSEANATSTTDGTFYAVITGVDRPFREAGIEEPEPLPAGAPAGVPRFDGNPERLRVDSDGQAGATALNVTSNTLLMDVVGVLDHANRSYTILPDASSAPIVAGSMAVVPVGAASNDELTVASFNMERFFDTVNDTGVSDVALSATAFNNRLNKASLTIRNVLGTPDIIGVEEMENLSTLQALAGRINSDAVAAGGVDPQYQAYLEEGNDPGGIDVGFLVKSSRVTVNSVMQFGLDEQFVDPSDGSLDLLNDRPPLVLNATVSRQNAPNLVLSVIVNHMRSLNDVETLPRVRAKRRAQAEYLANLIQAAQSADPNANIVSVGDYNAFGFNDGYVDVMGTIMGAPTPVDEVTLASVDLVDPNLVDLATTLSPDQQYSYVFVGNAQELDHVLVNNNMNARLSRFAIARVNADFPEVLRTDATRPERLSDHDPSVAYFNLPAQDFIAPTININSPTSSTYTLGTSFVADYSCSDASGVDTCAGPVASGGTVNASAVGSYTFTVNAADVYGNASQQSVTYQVGYKLCLLYNAAQVKNSGSTVAVKLQLCDAQGNNLSSTGTAITASALTSTGGTVYNAVGAGNSNRGGVFRYDAGLAGYIFNLHTNDVPAGSYLLSFMVEGDPTVHTVTVQLK